MTIISPSILAANFLQLQSEIERLEKLPNIWLHLDIMDGHFVPNMTFGLPFIKQIRKVTDLKLDGHFMVTNPEFYVEKLDKDDLYNFTFHLEATENPTSLIKKAKEKFSSVGISIKPHTKVELLTPELLEQLDLILIMSVEPGFGGQAFMPESLEKIKYLSPLAEKYDFQIQIDGGINDITAKDAISSGAHNLVAGSFIFKEPSFNYKKQVEILRNQ